MSTIPDELQKRRGEGGMPTDWSERFASGTDAEHPFGVLYQGEYETLHDGTNTAVRLHAKALSAHLPLLLQSFSHVVVSGLGAVEPVHTVGLDPTIKSQVGALRETSIATLVPIVKHAVVRDAEHLRNLLVPRGVSFSDPEQLMALRNAVLGATILYSVWERNTVHPDVVRWMQRCAQCWVPCQHNADVLVRSGVSAERVHVVPHPYDPADPLLKLTRRKPIRSKRFYSIGRWEPRKAYHELVGAFLMAYRPGDDATLTIKTTPHQWSDYPSADSSIALWLRNEAVIKNGWNGRNVSEHVTIIPRILGPDQIVKLHFVNNVYVSSSHGEAWNLGAFAAKLAGNGLVYVPWGGVADFASERDMPVDTTDLEPVHPCYGWGADAHWMGFDQQALVRALWNARAPERFERSADFEARFSLAAVGQRMAELVLQVADHISPQAAAYFRQWGADNASGAPAPK